MSEARGRSPRWDPDDRGIGVGDAGRHLAWLDALRAAADEDGWVAEEPQVHLLPHLLRRIADGAPWAIESSATEPDGTLVLDLRWTGPAGTDRRTVRAAAYGLIGVVAEGATAIHERREADVVTFEIVTGVLPGETAFASHGHTLRLRISAPPEAAATPDPA